MVNTSDEKWVKKYCSVYIEACVDDGKEIFPAEMFELVLDCASKFSPDDFEMNEDEMEDLVYQEFDRFACCCCKKDEE